MVFQFVELGNGAPTIMDLHAAQHGKCPWIASGKPGAAIAHDQRRAIKGKAPALSPVGPLLDGLEGVLGVDQRAPLFPGELDQAVIHQGKPLAEQGLVQGTILQYLACLWFHQAQAGRTIEPRAFIQPARCVEQALGIGMGIMGQLADQLPGKQWGGRYSLGGQHSESKARPSPGLEPTSGFLGTIPTIEEKGAHR